MKSLGIVRKIDETGRIVLPKDFRRRLALEPNADAVELFADGDQIIIRKYAALHFLRLVRRHFRVRGQACLQGLLVKAQRGYPSAEQVKTKQKSVDCKADGFFFLYYKKRSYIKLPRLLHIVSLAKSLQIY